MQAHQIEPELLRTTPRALRKRPNRSGQIGTGCLRIFIFPFILVGVGMIGTSLLTALVTAFGQTVPATIVGHHTKYDSESGTTYYLDFSFSMSGATQYATDKVASNEYDFYQDGSRLSVRAFPLLPTRGAQLQLAGKSPWKHALMWFGFALFWNGIVSVFVWAAWVAPMIERNLMARGIPTLGQISDKKTVSGEDSDSYILHYEYAPIEYSFGGPKGMNAFGSLTSQPLMTAQKGKMTVPKPDWDDAKIGDVVTVLFNAKNPKRSVLPRFSDWEVI